MNVSKWKERYKLGKLIAWIVPVSDNINGFCLLSVYYMPGMCSELYVYLSFNPQDNPMKLILFIFLFSIWETWIKERLGKVSLDT